jgi:hypothetical protein
VLWQHACALTVAAILALAPGTARPNCNVIPSAQASFRGALGSIDRPYAIPNDEGQQLAIELEPGGCDGASPGFLNVSGTPENDYFVTVLFEPPGDAPRHAVVLTTLANRELCDARLAAAAGTLSPGTASCRVVAAGTQELTFSSATRLQFRFPDTDSDLAPDGDDRSFTGPATIAVTSIGDALPFFLAGARCADTPGLIACIDELYEPDGTCGTAERHRGTIFGSFTALPPPNDYEALCTTLDTECDGTAMEVRFAVDSEGHALVPVDWRGVLLRPDGVPVPRLVRGDLRLSAFAGSPQPVRMPGRSFVASFSPAGIRLPPIFEPFVDPDSFEDLSLFGSADAPVGVLRLARRAADLSSGFLEYHQCHGGPDDGRPCLLADDCDGGSCGGTTCRVGGVNTGQTCRNDLECPLAAECGPSLFEFRDRLASGVGPVLVARTDYRLDAENPVPIEGLFESNALFAFVELEAVAGSLAATGPAPRDLNGDGDRSDAVVILRDRATGRIRPIGEANSTGRAVTRVRELPFTFSAVAAENDLVAFLEAEPLQFARDANGDGDVFDTILRVFRIGDDGAENLLVGLELAADAEPLIDGRSVVLSEGRLFFRTSELLAARRRTALEPIEGASRALTPTWVSEDGRSFHVFSPSFVRDRMVGTATALSGISAPRPALSADGRFIVFDSVASDLVPGDTNGVSDTFVRDRDADGDGIFDEPGAVSTERVSVVSGGTQAMPQVVPPGPICSGRSISRDGRHVAFKTAVFTGLDPERPDPPTSCDCFVHDRVTNDTTLVAIRSGPLLPCLLSGDARYVAIGRGIPGTGGVYLHDRDADRDGWLDEPDAIGEERIASLAAFFGLSRDGVVLYFDSDDPGLVPGDTNSGRDLFVYDAARRSLARASLTAEGLPAPQPGGLLNSYPGVSGDGRFSVFSHTSKLVVADTNSGPDVYLHDRLTGLTELVSATPSGVSGDGASTVPVLSEDGSTIVFASEATDLVAGDDNDTGDLFSRAPDADDLQNDFSGDGRLDDVVLRVLDTTVQPPSLATLGPAEAVSVAGGAVAFLRPESADGVDRDGDGSLDGARVHLWTGGEAVDLERNALEIGLSRELLGARVSVPGGRTDLDIYDRAAASPGWQRVAEDVRDLAIAGSVVAFRAGPTHELRISDHRSGRPVLLATGREALDYVLGEGIVAFRTPEAAAGEDLNGDGDSLDAVLQAYDLVSAQLVNTGAAATPCRLEACDPRQPYRVAGDTITFLTLEAEQGGRDLDGDGSAKGIVVQTFHVREAIATQAAGAGAARSQTSTTGEILGTLDRGTCSNSAQACASDVECGEGGSCFLPPGRCVEDLRTPCTFPPGEQAELRCAELQFCRPLEPEATVGTCHVELGACTTDADCHEPSACEDADEDVVRLVNPLALRPRGRSGEQLFVTGAVSSRRTDRPCATDAQCGSDLCTGAGFCQSPQPELVLAGAADGDGDGLADPFDNCPAVANADQRDENENEVGDACDLLVRGIVAAIDVRPASRANRVNPSARGIVEVALLATRGLDTADVDAATLALGPGGAVPLRVPRLRLIDVDRDADRDLIAAFRIADLGLAPGDEELCLAGQTRDGVPFRGCDRVRTGPGVCGLGVELALLLWLLRWGHSRTRTARSVPSSAPG